MPTEITGELRTFMDAFGVRIGDTRLEPALALLGEVEETPPVRNAGALYSAVRSLPSGVSIMLRDGVVLRAFIYLTPQKGFTPYARPEALVDGLDLGAANRETVRAFFGPPIEELPAFDYFHAGYDIAVGYDDDGAVTTILPMVESA